MVVANKAELVAQQLLGAEITKKQWGAAMYNVLIEGLSGDGVTDDTAKLQLLVDKAIAEGRRAIFFPHGTYYVTALNNADQVTFFGDNATFVGGYMGVINQFGAGGIGKSDLDAINAKFPPIPMVAAKGDNVTDDGIAIQNIINYAMNIGRNVYFPCSIYKIGSTLLMDRNVAGQQERTSLFGDGPGLSILNYTGTGVLLDIRGTLSTDLAMGTQGVTSYQNIRDLYLSGNNYSGTAIKTTNNSHFKLTNVKIMGFDYGLHMVDIENSVFDMVIVSWCSKGMLFEQQEPWISYSTRPNNLNFYGCSVGGCLQFGIHVKGGSTFNWLGGMISNNGYNNPTNMSDLSWGIKIEDACYQGGVACNILGTYFEDNAGKADVWLVNNTNITPVINDAVYMINGSSFNRTTNEHYSKNNICCTFAATAGKQKLCLIGGGFKFFGSYVEDGARKNVGFDGAVLTPTKDNFESIGTVFKSSVEGLSVDKIAKPFIEISKSNPQNIPSGAWTKWGIDLTFAQKNWDATLDSVNNRVPIPENGVYTISANVIFAASATGKRGIRLVHSAYGIIANTYAAADSLEFYLSISTTKQLNKDQTITVEVFQDSGGALELKGANLYYTYLNIAKLVDI